jgi:hypothetical protein
MELHIEEIGAGNDSRFNNGIFDINEGDTVKIVKIKEKSIYKIVQDNFNIVEVVKELKNTISGHVCFIAKSSRPTDDGIEINIKKGYVFVQTGNYIQLGGNFECPMFDFENFDFYPIRLLLLEKIKKGRF